MLEYYVVHQHQPGPHFEFILCFNFRNDFSFLTNANSECRRRNGGLPVNCNIRPPGVARVVTEQPNINPSNYTCRSLPTGLEADRNPAYLRMTVNGWCGATTGLRFSYLQITEGCAAAVGSLRKMPLSGISEWLLPRFLEQNLKPIEAK